MDRENTHRAIMDQMMVWSLADYAAGILPNIITNISTKLNANAGTVTKVDLEGIKEGSTITYHVCTPTLISIDSNGNLFAKKAGNGILMANLTYGNATTLYTICVMCQGTFSVLFSTKQHLIFKKGKIYIEISVNLI